MKPFGFRKTSACSLILFEAMSTVRPDELDIRILEQLQLDGRMPFSRIAAALGVSDVTVRTRVTRLVDAKLVRFVTDIDPGQLGLIEVYLGILIQGPALDRAVATLTAIPEVTYAVELSGAFDLLCEVIARDNDDLLRLLREVRTTPGVTRVETLTVLRIHKETWRFAGLAGSR